MTSVGIIKRGCRNVTFIRNTISCVDYFTVYRVCTMLSGASFDCQKKRIPSYHNVILLLGEEEWIDRLPVPLVCLSLSFCPSPSPSLSLSHTHTHTHTIQKYALRNHLAYYVMQFSEWIQVLASRCGARRGHPVVKIRSATVKSIFQPYVCACVCMFVCVCLYVCVC